MNKKKNIKRVLSGSVFAAYTPAWLEWIPPDRFIDNDLFRIIVFFVFHSPCTGSGQTLRPASAMHKPICDYGWSSKWGNYKSPNSLNYILRRASTNFSLIFSATGNDDMFQACKKADLLDEFPNDMLKERMAISISDQNQVLSLFKHIRNAFAHSRFAMHDIVGGDYVFIFEDVSSDGKKVSARIIIRKSTLIKWIDIIEAGPE